MSSFYKTNGSFIVTAICILLVSLLLLSASEILLFYLHNAMLAWYLLSSCVRPSVRPSQVGVYENA